MKKKVKIIAEIGINHNGNLKIAEKLISMAARYGADYVKFQAYRCESLLQKNTRKAHYQKKFSSKENQFQMLKKYEIGYEFFKKLLRISKKNKISFLLSFFDTESLKLVKELKLNTIKIPSGEINNYQLISEIGKLKKKVILSSGISTLSEIKNAISILTNEGTKKKDITILHCNSDYPTPLKDVNLRAINLLKDKFKQNVGYSDHTLGFETSIAAVCLGASIIEKHFTLNNKLKGPDHKSSLNPEEFKQFIKLIKNTETLLGQKTKIPTKSEKKNKYFIRKSLVAKTMIKKGEFFSRKNITTLRPENGLKADKYFKIIGKKAKKNYSKNMLI